MYKPKKGDLVILRQLDELNQSQRSFFTNNGPNYVLSYRELEGKVLRVISVESRAHSEDDQNLWWEIKVRHGDEEHWVCSDGFNPLERKK